MAEFKQLESGLVLPEPARSAEPKFRRTFYQERLLTHQLPRYLEHLEDKGARLIAITQDEPDFCSRYVVIYSHHEELAWEVYT